MDICLLPVETRVLSRTGGGRREGAYGPTGQAHKDSEIVRGGPVVLRRSGLCRPGPLEGVVSL